MKTKTEAPRTGKRDEKTAPAKGRAERTDLPKPLAVARKLADGYRRQAELYELILGVTEAQNERLKDGAPLSMREAGHFLSLLDQKMELLGSIGRIEEDLESWREAWRGGRPRGQSRSGRGKARSAGAGSAAPTRRGGRLSQILENIRSTIENTIRVEKENRKLLAGQRRATRPGPVAEEDTSATIATGQVERPARIDPDGGSDSLADSHSAAQTETLPVDGTETGHDH